MVDECDYDGIDFDWEYPDTEEEIVGFQRLVETFRARLDALGSRKQRRMLLTMAVSANPGTLRWLRPEFMMAHMDWLNVMTYDYAGNWTSYAGHNSPLYASSKQPGSRRVSVRRTITYLLEDRQYKPAYLALGIPLYGRGFYAPRPYAKKKESGAKRIPRGNYRNLHELVDDPQWKRLWDEETKTPWLLSRDGDIVISPC